MSVPVKLGDLDDIGIMSDGSWLYMGKTDSDKKGFKSTAGDILNRSFSSSIPSARYLSGIVSLRNEYSLANFISSNSFGQTDVASGNVALEVESMSPSPTGNCFTKENSLVRLHSYDWDGTVQSSFLAFNSDGELDNYSVPYLYSGSPNPGSYRDNYFHPEYELRPGNHSSFRKYYSPGKSDVLDAISVSCPLNTDCTFSLLKEGVYLVQVSAFYRILAARVYGVASDWRPVKFVAGYSMDGSLTVIAEKTFVIAEFGGKTFTSDDLLFFPITGTALIRVTDPPKNLVFQVALFDSGGRHSCYWELSNGAFTPSEVLRYGGINITKVS